MNGVTRTVALEKRWKIVYRDEYVRVIKAIPNKLGLISSWHTLKNSWKRCCASSGKAAPPCVGENFTRKCQKAMLALRDYSLSRAARSLRGTVRLKPSPCVYCFKQRSRRARRACANRSPRWEKISPKCFSVHELKKLL